MQEIQLNFSVDTKFIGHKRPIIMIIVNHEVIENRTEQEEIVVPPATKRYLLQVVNIFGEHA